MGESSVQSDYSGDRESKSGSLELRVISGDRGVFVISNKGFLEITCRIACVLPENSSSRKEACGDRERRIWKRRLDDYEHTLPAIARGARRRAEVLHELHRREPGVWSGHWQWITDW